MADFAIDGAEGAIGSHLVISSLQVRGTTPTTPATVRAAIRKLRNALKPFIRDWVDTETVELLARMVDLAAFNDALILREKELLGRRVASERHRLWQILCSLVGAAARQAAEMAGIPLNDREVLRFVDQALSDADIPHPSAINRPGRLTKLVFPKP
jgi:hypothetical protein